jgi:hypothetical protein
MTPLPAAPNTLFASYQSTDQPRASAAARALGYITQSATFGAR